MNLRQATHKRPKKKKEARISSSDDDEVDFWGAAIGIGASLLGSYMSGNKASNARNQSYNPYNINQLRSEQAESKGLYQDMAGYGRKSMGFGEEMYQQGQDLYDQGQQFFDVGSEHNQLMRKGVMDDSMNQIGLQNTLAQRQQGGGDTGISRANAASNTLAGQGQAQQNFLQGYQQNMGIGQGLLGQAMGQQQAGMGTFQAGVGNVQASAQGQAGLAENIQQAQISNNEMRNQKYRDDADYHSGMSNSFMSLGSNLLSFL
tara:strand:+ start:3710 stop:4489 length:780 start_codon:yes stop_codon:yes gene_type:complete